MDGARCLCTLTSAAGEKKFSRPKQKSKMDIFEDYDLPVFDIDFDVDFDIPVSEILQESTLSTLNTAEIEENAAMAKSNATTTTKRFANLSELDLEKLLLDKQSDRTKKTTNWCVATFKAWCKEKKIQTPLERMTIGQLDANLRRFYPEARKKDGDLYGKKTLLGFRHGIERFLNQPPFSRNVNVAKDERFNKSNAMLDAQLVNLKRSGKDNTKHKPTIEDEDLVKLKNSTVISLNSPLSLLRNVWFHVVLFFCRRGREGQRDLTKASFKCDVDGAGRNYIDMAHDEVSKNHQGGIKDTSSTEKCGRLYETSHQNDGFKAVMLYFSKMNPQCTTFQYPKKDWVPGDEEWFENKPVGVNRLGGMMKEISQVARLSRMYTNHSVRATAITLWSNAGVPNRHIMAISGHKNEQSLAHYNTRPSTAQLHNCSDVLARSLDRGSSAMVPSQPIQPSLQLSTAVQHNNPLLSQAQTKSPLHFDSVFNHCTIENVQVVYQ